MGSALADQVSSRLDRARRLAAQAGVDALVVTPGPDSPVPRRGRQALPRTALRPGAARPTTRPRSSSPAWSGPGSTAPASTRPASGVLDWVDGEDPHGLVAACLDGAKRVAVASDMPALHVLGLRDALPLATQELATGGAARAADAQGPGRGRVPAPGRRGHRRGARPGPGWLRAGRTEAEVGADITAAIVAAGHSEAAFVIVGSGPNGASPHHELSDRVIETGDVVVVDIGGPLPEGYNSDCTRTYVVGGPTDEVTDVYGVLQRAQAAAVAAARPGVTAESVDEAARAIIRDAGFGEYFVHRTGHGIGLEVHEEPYIVAGNALTLEPGMAFSIEPGIYFPERWGARIEDIVVVTDDGCEAVNTRPHELLSC